LVVAVVVREYLLFAESVYVKLNGMLAEAPVSARYAMNDVVLVVYLAGSPG
jgi:hypothetical protein